MYPWFIFSSGEKWGSGRCTVVYADMLTQAVAAWRRSKRPGAGEIIGVIRGSAHMSCLGNLSAMPVFGVVCCVAEQNGPVHQVPASPRP